MLPFPSVSPKPLTLASGVETFLGDPSSANLRTALTDETGTGLACFQGGDLGTPSAGVLTNCTGLPLSGLGAMARVSGSTYSTVQHMQDIFHSSGHSSGGTITDAGGGNVDVAAGTGFIRATDSEVAEVKFFDWSSIAGNAIPSNTTRYIGIEWNAGTPQVVVKTTYDWDFNTDFPLGNVVNDAGTLHVENAPHKVGDHANQMIQRTYQTMPLQRDDRTGGLIIGETGTRNVTMSAGALWERIERFAIAAIDTSVASTFDRYYRDGVGGWTEELAQTQWPNTQYDDDSGTLVTMTNNRYANLWFYIDLDGGLIALYPQAQYANEADAEAETPPSSTPDRISVQGKLIGRLIFKKSAATATAIESVFGVTFQGAIVTDHANLSDLAWTSSGHSGTATRIAAFDGTGAAAEYTMSGTGTEVALTTSPTFVTPALGTPASGVGTNLTGTAAGLTAGNVTTNANLTGHVTSVGNAAVLGSFSVAQLNTAINDGTIATGGGTATGTNTGDQTITLTGGVTGSGTGSFAATVVTNANLTGPITSTGNATAVAAQTGTGSTFVMQASPTLTTPNIGTPSAGVATNLTGLPLTTGVTGVLPIANGGASGLTATYVPMSSGGTVLADSPIIVSGTKIGVGVSPAANVHSLSTSEQLRIGYDATHYAQFTVNSSGKLAIVTNQPNTWISTTAAIADPIETIQGLILAATITNTGSNAMKVYGLNASTVISSATDTTGEISGGFFNGQKGSTGTATTLYGVLGRGYNVGAGTVTNLRGVVGQVQNLNASGTVTNLVGGYFFVNFNQGIATNTAGVEIGDVTGSGTHTNQSYGLKQTDTNARNYFGGNLGVGELSPDDKLHVTVGSSDAVECLKLEQLDVSEGFCNFVSTSAASVVNPITSWTTGNSIQGFVRVEINGTDRWMPFYDAPTS